MRRTALSKDSVAGYFGSMPWKCGVSPVARRSWLVLFLQVIEPKRTCPVSPPRLGSSGDPGREARSWSSGKESRGVCPQRGVGKLLPASGEWGPRGECSEAELAPAHGSPVSGDPAPSGSLRRRGDAMAACQDMAPVFRLFESVLTSFFEKRRLFQEMERARKKLGKEGNEKRRKAPAQAHIGQLFQRSREREREKKKQCVISIHSGPTMRRGKRGRGR